MCSHFFHTFLQAKQAAATDVNCDEVKLILCVLLFLFSSPLLVIANHDRWLHNIEHGAIVLIYHPCANGRLADDLKKIVKTCLRRHVITPHRALTPERPFALAAWGVSLEFAIFDRQLVVDFIRKYAKIAPEKTPRDGQYRKLLIEAAKIVSDENDTELCGEEGGKVM